MSKNRVDDEVWALWNGELMRLADVRVPVLDRGWLFGDAVYEVLRLYNGQAFLLAEHEARLERSLAGLGIARPPGLLREKIKRLVAQSGLREGLIYVQISRGAGPRQHVPQADLIPNELVYLQAVDEKTAAHKRRQGIRARLVQDARWGRTDLKTVNLLGNCLAAMEAKSQGADEAILVDRDGYVTEGSHTSVFAVCAGSLVTPPLYQGILPGVTRAAAIRLVHEVGLPCEERRLAAAELATAEELFLTGTVSEILPVRELDGRPVGLGAPGTLTRRLQERYDTLVGR